MLVVQGSAKDAKGKGVALCRVEATFEVEVTPAETTSTSTERRMSSRRSSGRTAEGDGSDGGGTATATAAPPKSYRTVVRTSAITADDGSFQLELPNTSDLGDSVHFAVSAPAGGVIGELDVAVGDLDKAVAIEVNTVAQIQVEPGKDGQPTRTKVVGRVFDVKGTRVPADLQVVVYATTKSDTPEKEAAAIAITRTDGGGYFTAERPQGDLFLAFARVGAIKAPIEIHLDGHALPEPLLLPIDLSDLKLDDPKDCACEGSVIPRTPDQYDLANSPATFSTDLGTGCVTFNVPNRAIEEFDFYSVVRTTEPDIRGVTLGGSATNGHAAQKNRAWTIMLERLRRGLGRGGLGEVDRRLLAQMLASMGSPEAAELLMTKDELTEEDLNHLLELVSLQEMSSQVDLVGRAPGRAVLDATRSVDWDSSPTFYEAVSIAHGHLLHFKQTWYADGYSLGDLLYSLPLAPGQKRLIAVVDWERRDQASRAEEQTISESLSALLSRDRDLNEVVSGALAESMRGGSRATTSGIGGGMGGAMNGSYYGTNFGALHGISGGYGQSDASAWEDASRNMSAQSLQQLRDKTLQSASAVRGLRSTAVYTATEGEAVRASTEIVANHNHCHALTIQYFEVLRHLKLVHDLADVRECLFVPLPMEAFDRAKTLRWRESLQPYLRRPDLTPAFDSARRVETNWADVDYPAGRYGDETVNEVFGEFELTILAPLPPIPEAPKPKPGETAVDAVAAVGNALNPTTGFLGGLLAVATGGLSLLAGAGANAVTQGAHAVAESLLTEPSAQERYDRFQHDVMPGVAVGFVDQLELYALVNNNEVKLSGADFTLVSEYRAGASLLCSVRGTLSNQYKRSDITELILKSKNGLPSGCRAIVNSASIRYRTSSFEHPFVVDSRVNDDIELPKINITVESPVSIKIDQYATGRGATLYTPLDSWEQRNPRKEDQRLTADLIDHLNDGLEYYHQAIWWTMDPNRRYMLLDGFLAPNSGNRSVASVVDNRLIGIAGNSLILPVADGVHLDPRFESKDDAATIDLKAHYAPAMPVPPARVSLPTRGVFAEAVMGSCNACEKIDETRYWRWDEVPLEDVPAIQPLSTDSRRADLAATTTPSVLPTPMIAIQNAPAAPDPTGLAMAAELLGKETFPDITGLAASQAAASQAYQKALETSVAYAKEASTLAQQASMMKGGLQKTLEAIDQAHADGKIDDKQQNELTVDAIKKQIGSDGKEMSKQDVEDLTDTAGRNQAKIDVSKPSGETVAVDAKPDPSKTPPKKTGQPGTPKPKTVPVSIKFRAFVPSEIWEPFPNWTNPIGELVRFNGDNRDFSLSTGSSRAELQLDLRIDPAKLEATIDKQTPLYGIAEVYAESDTDDVTGQAEWWEKKKDSGVTPLLRKRMKPEEGRLDADISNLGDKSIVMITLNAQPQFPWFKKDLDGIPDIEVAHVSLHDIVDAILSLANPNLDATVQIEFTRNANNQIEYKVTGYHDKFPAYELYVNGERTYEFMPSGDKAPNDLTPPGNTRVIPEKPAKLLAALPR